MEDYARNDATPPNLDPDALAQAADDVITQQRDAFTVGPRLCPMLFGHALSMAAATAMQNAAAAAVQQGGGIQVPAGQQRMLRVQVPQGMVEVLAFQPWIADPCRCLTNACAWWSDELGRCEPFNIPDDLDGGGDQALDVEDSGE